MGIRRVGIVAAAAAIVAGMAGPAIAATSPDQYAARTVQQLQRGAGAECRRAGVNSDDDACATFDGRAISRQHVDDYQSSWVHRALSLQRGLALRAPLFEAQLPHTHNSFNSSSYSPTLTNQDPNQVYSLTDQLDMDIRAIELDVHWVPSPSGTAETGGFWVTLCHGNSGNPLGVHVGCSNDRPFQDGLQEVAAWLSRHPGQFVVLYLENQLGDNEQAHQIAGDLIQRYLGGMVEAPTTPCGDMDWSTCQAAMLGRHHQVAIVGNCGAGAGTGWGALVHERGPQWDEHGDPSAYSNQQCVEDSAARRTDSSFRRYFEDSTWVAATAGSNPATSSLGGTSTISTSATKQMVQCGVNIIGFDQLVPEDPRLAALVWSWATNEPRAAVDGGGSCAYQSRQSRFVAGRCSQRRAVACAMPSGSWRVTKARVDWSGAAAACAGEFPGSRFAVPANGYRNRTLATAKPAGTTEVWLNYRTGNGDWVAG
jgi:hypothetical protein